MDGPRSCAEARTMNSTGLGPGIGCRREGYTVVGGNGYEGSLGLLASGKHAPLDDWGSALAEALDMVPELPAFLKDNNRRFLWCSTPLARIAGFDRQQDLLGKRDEDLSPAYLAAQYRLNDERVLRRGERMIGVVE